MLRFIHLTHSTRIDSSSAIAIKKIIALLSHHKTFNMLFENTCSIVRLIVGSILSKIDNNSTIRFEDDGEPRIRSKEGYTMTLKVHATSIFLGLEKVK